jgi:hypothetical protein
MALYQRYGSIFKCLSDETASLSQEEWQKICAIFGYSNVDVDEEVKHVASALVKYFVDRKSQIPPRDLSVPDHMVESCENSAFHLTTFDDEHNFYYLLKNRSDTGHWIMVRHAATVLQCVRGRWGPHLMNIACHMAEHGIPFNTLSSIPRSNPHTPRTDSVGLGWRKPGYKPDAFEYTAYEQRRDAFLTQPHARAAMLMGGIVWRLAKHAFDQADITSGPSVNAVSGCIPSSSSHPIMYDDVLSQDEVDLICGVYKVYTCKWIRMIEVVFSLTHALAYGTQTSDMSWWPKQSVWMNSGLNWGYWTEACETWFQKRLKSIRDGTAGLKTSGEWHSGPLKYSKKISSKVVSGNEEDSREFIYLNFPTTLQ